MPENEWWSRGQRRAWKPVQDDLLRNISRLSETSSYRAYLEAEACSLVSLMTCFLAPPGPLQPGLPRKSRFFGKRQAVYCFWSFRLLPPNVALCLKTSYNPCQPFYGNQRYNAITYSPAPKALRFVSARISLNVFTTTAINKLINQKFSTMTPAMKKRDDPKKSESIAMYMTGAHVLTASS